MAKLEPDPDTTLPLSEEELARRLTEEMKLAGTSNDTEHSQFVSGDEVDLLGDGIPGEETTGVPLSDDEIELDQLAMTTPVPRPNKK